MDVKALRTLLRLLREHDLEELEIEEAGRRVRLRRRAGPPAAPSPTASAPGERLRGAAANVPAAPSQLAVTAPMVGTFYRAPAPGAEPFVTEGSWVEKGTVVCIIEAMKLMNEIEAEVRGRVVSILAENGQPVEYGQPLILLEPA